MKYLFFTLVLFIKPLIKSKADCSDLLETYAEKPKKLKFLDCSPGDGPIVLESKYLVSGKDAQEIEAYLIEKYSIGKLKFVDLGWESSVGKFESKKIKEINTNYALKIKMFGSSELRNKQGDLYLQLDPKKIHFYITVSLLDTSL